MPFSVLYLGRPKESVGPGTIVSGSAPIPGALVGALCLCVAQSAERIEVGVGVGGGVALVEGRGVQVLQACAGVIDLAGGAGLHVGIVTGDRRLGPQDCRRPCGGSGGCQPRGDRVADELVERDAGGRSRDGGATVLCGRSVSKSGSAISPFPETLAS